MGMGPQRKVFTPRGLGMVAVAAAAAIAIAVAALALVGEYLEERGRPNSAALEVEDTTYTLRDVARRLNLYLEEIGGRGAKDGSPEKALTAIANRLIEEEILRRFASELGIDVTPEEVDQALRSRLGVPEGGSEGEQAPFPQLLQRELERTGLSEAKYRALVEGDLRRQRASSHFYDQAPIQAESVRFRRIVVRGPAEPVLARLQAGQEFAEVARELSLDLATRANGGEVGWVPRGALDPAMEEALFSLQPGQIGTYNEPSSGLTYIFRVEEMDPRRVLEPPERQAIANRLTQRWVEEKKAQLKIVNYIDPALGDPEKIAWILKEVYG